MKLESQLILLKQYPFGMLMPGRSYSSPAYRYGFNGQEKDDEVAGVGNINTAEFWEYDCRLGRRWNFDPKPNESISVYSCFGNNPIDFADIDGDTLFNKGGQSQADLRGMVAFANQSRVIFNTLANPADPNFTSYVTVNVGAIPATATTPEIPAYFPGTDAGLDLLIQMSNSPGNYLYEVSNSYTEGAPIGVNAIPAGATNNNVTIPFTKSTMGPEKTGVESAVSNFKQGINSNAAKEGRNGEGTKYWGCMPQSKIGGFTPGGVPTSFSLTAQVTIHPNTEFNANSQYRGTGTIPRSAGVFFTLQSTWLIVNNADILNKSLSQANNQAAAILRSPNYQGHGSTATSNLQGAPVSRISALPTTN